jgi:hypothetical protein
LADFIGFHRYLEALTRQFTRPVAPAGQKPRRTVLVHLVAVVLVLASIPTKILIGDPAVQISAILYRKTEKASRDKKLIYMGFHKSERLNFRSCFLMQNS